jgi:hypothetical protein
MQQLESSRKRIILDEWIMIGEGILALAAIIWAAVK